MILIFGHFFAAVFRAAAGESKNEFQNHDSRLPLGVADDFARSGFNIFPRIHPDGYPFKWLWLQLGCFLFMAGFLAWVFLKKFLSHPPYPQRDPRLLEAMGLVHDEPEEIARHHCRRKHCDESKTKN